MVKVKNYQNMHLNGALKLQSTVEKQSKGFRGKTRCLGEREGVGTEVGGCLIQHAQRLQLDQ